MHDETAGGERPPPPLRLDEHEQAAAAPPIEEQALAQLRAAPKIAGEPKLEEIFQQHLSETERQEQMVRQRLEAHGGSPSAIKEVVMRAGGAGFVLFAKSQPDTPGK